MHLGNFILAYHPRQARNGNTLECSTKSAILLIYIKGTKGGFWKELKNNLEKSNLIPMKGESDVWNRKASHHLY